MSEIKRVDVRDLSRWTDQHRTYKTKDEFFQTETLESGIHSFEIGSKSLIFDCLLNNTGSRNLLVTFGGAISPKKRKGISFPVFSGVNIAKGLNYSVLSIADPSLVLTPDLGLSWYAGSLGVNLPALIVKVIQHVARAVGSESIFLLGGSGGGFAALNASQRIPGSIVVCMNPQTNIESYYKGLANQFAKACFGRGTFSLIPQEHKIRHRTNLLDVYNASHRNHIFYLQNLSDEHLVRHATPFARALGYKGEILSDRVGAYELTTKAIMVVGNWGMGHIATPKPQLRTILKFLAEPNGVKRARLRLKTNNTWITSPTLLSSKNR